MCESCAGCSRALLSDKAHGQRDRHPPPAPRRKPHVGYSQGPTETWNREKVQPRKAAGHGNHGGAGGKGSDALGRSSSSPLSRTFPCALLLGPESLGLRAVASPRPLCASVSSPINRHSASVLLFHETMVTLGPCVLGTLWFQRSILSFLNPQGTYLALSVSCLFCGGSLCGRPSLVSNPLKAGHVRVWVSLMAPTWAGATLDLHSSVIGILSAVCLGLGTSLQPQCPSGQCKPALPQEFQTQPAPRGPKGKKGMAAFLEMPRN